MKYFPHPDDEWRDIPGYENLYQINQRGVVRSFHFGKIKYISRIADTFHRELAYCLSKNGSRVMVRFENLMEQVWPEIDVYRLINHREVVKKEGY